jgi:hypothetical protein
MYYYYILLQATLHLEHVQAAAVVQLPLAALLTSVCHEVCNCCDTLPTVLCC